MEINVKHLAKLAHISIEEGSENKVQGDLEETIKLVDKMMAVDTSTVQPMAYPHDGFQRLREDCITEQPNALKMQESAPKSDQGYYLVPKVID